MKIFYHFLTVCFLFFIFGCSHFSLVDYEKIADKITEETAKELKEQKNRTPLKSHGRPV